jgi:hypothetical protein
LGGEFAEGGQHHRHEQEAFQLRVGVGRREEDPDFVPLGRRNVKGRSEGPGPQEAAAGPGVHGLGLVLAFFSRCRSQVLDALLQGVHQVSRVLDLVIGVICALEL